MDLPLTSTPFLCHNYGLDPRPALLVVLTVQEVPSVAPITVIEKAEKVDEIQTKRTGLGPRLVVRFDARF